jgi:DnaJ like chaperone protein
MGKFTKWIAGGLGWAFLGPIGGIAGFIIGSMIDETAETKSLGFSASGTTPGGYAMSLLVLVAAVMKADQKVMRSELDYVRDYFVFESQLGIRPAQLLVRCYTYECSPFSRATGSVDR